MGLMLRNIKKLSTLGPRGCGVFLGPEARLLKWKKGDQLMVAVYTKGKKKGVVIEKF